MHFIITYVIWTTHPINVSDIKKSMQCNKYTVLPNSTTSPIYGMKP